MDYSVNLDINLWGTCIVTLVLMILNIIFIISRPKHNPILTIIVCIVVGFIPIIFNIICLISLPSAIDAKINPDIQVVEAKLYERKVERGTIEPSYFFITDDDTYYSMGTFYVGDLKLLAIGKYYRVWYEDKTDLIMHVEEIESPEKLE